jgi:hypothetical protein
VSGLLRDAVLGSILTGRRARGPAGDPMRRTAQQLGALLDARQPDRLQPAELALLRQWLELLAKEEPGQPTS